MSPATSTEDLVSAEALSVTYKVRTGFLGSTHRVIKPVDCVDLSVRKGEVMTVIGESGSGKSTLGFALLRLVKPSAGRVLFSGQDIGKAKGSDLRELRRQMQIVFQDPYSSLDPRLHVKDIVSEPLIGSGMKDPGEIDDRTSRAMTMVGLDPSAKSKYVHEFSGGQRQRIGIARAIVGDPQFVVLDEPTSNLDVSIQAQILNLLMDLQSKSGASYLFISHNMAVSQYVSDRVAVMYAGEVVERGTSEEVIGEPMHPYTQDLLSCVPTMDISRKVTDVKITGDPPSFADLPRGCRYSNRCKRAFDLCKEKEPALAAAGGREVACFLYHKEERAVAPPER
ncbi:MAG: ABC transporter ATP-binding protein [Nitrososphaerota archaeon]|nr:ABC transporter ATP-binding protein [Nitrososphaerota archaeon]MDG6941998.1 ABC transporter ATP-binding protein [Nitrososphaerota archaeon]MDG6942463.1 ABC transporter ATP-binding protein [Nitrososphaerota archaeon]MDG6948250.1 ABC transporter ATP-binding protein [Nitrososphaerota archaeon]